MIVVFHDGPSVLTTLGQGDIRRDEPREMSEDYAFSLIESGQVEAANEDSMMRYETMRKERLTGNPNYNPAERLSNG